jgi:hypothetical protein
MPPDAQSILRRLQTRASQPLASTVGDRLEQASTWCAYKAQLASSCNNKAACRAPVCPGVKKGRPARDDQYRLQGPGDGSNPGQSLHHRAARPAQRHPPLKLQQGPCASSCLCCHRSGRETTGCTSPHRLHCLVKRAAPPSVPHR